MQPFAQFEFNIGCHNTIVYSARYFPRSRQCRSKQHDIPVYDDDPNAAHGPEDPNQTLRRARTLTIVDLLDTVECPETNNAKQNPSAASKYSRYLEIPQPFTGKAVLG